MQDINLDELLEITSGKIVGEKRHQGILRALIESPVGAWRPITELDQTELLAQEIRGFSPDFGAKVVEGLRLAWTLNPDDPENKSFCTILFFYGRDDLMWHSLALFNRDIL